MFTNPMNYSHGETKSQRLIRAEEQLEDIRDPSPAPGSGYWDSPLVLPDVWSASAPNKRIGLTLGLAFDHFGSAQASAATYPFSRLAFYLLNRGLGREKLGSWFKVGRVQTDGGNPYERSLVVGVIIDGVEYREVDGLVFERALEGERR
jgi:hypothetical protein